MSKHTKQRWPEHTELAEILDDVKYGTPCLFEIARVIFNDAVDPDVYHRNASKTEIDQCNMAFSEWTLFDFDMGNEMTPLKRAARQDPSLSEFASTQFYSVFWVISQDRHSNMTRLRDIITCEDFVVHDPMLAHNARWAKGLLGSRIARVDGVWRLAGQVHLHDNAECHPLPHNECGDGLGIQNPVAFLGHVQSVMGHEGIYNDRLLESGFVELEVPV